MMKNLFFGFKQPNYLFNLPLDNFTNEKHHTFQMIVQKLRENCNSTFGLGILIRSNRSVERKKVLKKFFFSYLILL